MTDKIQMDYSDMVDMANVFKKSATELEELKKNMKKIADEMDGGVLVGQTGQAFSGGIREALIPALDRLIAKMRELNNDVIQTKEDMRKADASVEPKFK